MRSMHLALRVAMVAAVATLAPSSAADARAASREPTDIEDVYRYTFDSDADRLIIIRQAWFERAMGEMTVDAHTSEDRLALIFSMLHKALGILRLPGSAHRFSFDANRNQSFVILLDCPGRFRPRHLGSFSPDSWNDVGMRRAFMCGA